MGGSIGAARIARICEKKGGRPSALGQELGKVESKKAPRRNRGKKIAAFHGGKLQGEIWGCGTRLKVASGVEGREAGRTS